MKKPINPDGFETFDFKELPQSTVYRLMIDAIIPRPIAWVSTINLSGQINLAPFSFFNAVSSEPPCLMISVSTLRDVSLKDTARNILETKEFVVNSSNQGLAEALNQTSAPYEYGTNEMEKVGLKPIASKLIRPPRLLEAALSMECKLVKAVKIGEGDQLGGTTLLIGQILMMHVQKDLWDGQRISAEKLAPLSRLGGNDYGLTSGIFSLTRPQV